MFVYDMKLSKGGFILGSNTKKNIQNQAILLAESSFGSKEFPLGPHSYMWKFWTGIIWHHVHVKYWQSPSQENSPPSLRHYSLNLGPILVLKLKSIEGCWNP